jgi:hypothetical protein
MRDGVSVLHCFGASVEDIRLPAPRRGSEILAPAKAAEAAARG